MTYLPIATKRPHQAFFRKCSAVRIPFLALAAVTLVASSAAHAQQQTISPTQAAPQQQELGKTDRDIVYDAARRELFETGMSRLVLRNSQNAEVRELAETVIEDHGYATAKMRKVLDPLGFEGSSELYQDQGRELDQIRGLQGAAFDRAYMDSITQTHVISVGLFEQMSSAAQNPELRQAAAEVLPRVRHHLAMMQDLKQRIPR